MNFNGETEEQTDKNVYAYTLEVNTPLEGYEMNKLSERYEISTDIIYWQSNGYLGSPSKVKTSELYGKLTGVTGETMIPMLESFVKTDVYGYVPLTKCTLLTIPTVVLTI